MKPTDVDQQLTGLMGLADPVRRALYRHVSERGVAVARDEAARAVGISRALAAYHLDKLVDDGLLEARFERRTGRRGPGAGRPAKLYLRSARRIELSLPARDYAALAELLARAVEADPSGAARSALHSAARTLGAELGAEIARRLAAEGRQASGGRPEGAGRAEGDRRPVLAAVHRVLASRGYEPFGDADGTIRLRNCPFGRIAAQHPELVCGANLAIVQGLVDQLGGDHTIRPVLDPAPGRCCVALTSDPS
jgi:predicted ArsR family transcriptional regulator